jgi:hypothetical protein
MNRELALKMVLGLVGLVFLALAYPLILFVRQDPGTSMMFSIYVTLGVFLLLAIRNPPASRSLIAFTAWSSFAHAAIMGTQAMRDIVSTSRTGGCGSTRCHRRNLDSARAGKSKTRCRARLTPSARLADAIPWRAKPPRVISVMGIERAATGTHAASPDIIAGYVRLFGQAIATEVL